jgi:hypothetical protein
MSSRPHARPRCCLTFSASGNTNQKLTPETAAIFIHFYGSELHFCETVECNTSQKTPSTMELSPEEEFSCWNHEAVSRSRDIYRGKNCFRSPRTTSSFRPSPYVWQLHLQSSSSLPMWHLFQRLGPIITKNTATQAPKDPNI